MDGTGDGAARDDLMPYGVDTIRLRISFPAAPASRGYNGRAWKMRPLRGWTGGARWDEEAVARAEQGGHADEGTASVPAGAAQQVNAGSSLRATLDRVIAAMEASAVKAQGGVQLAQAEPPIENETTRRAEPNSEELGLPEVGRVGRYGNLRSQLQGIDPDNPLLQTLADPKRYVPTEVDIDALELALARARARPPASQGPVNTFADPGGPESSSEAQTSRPTEWGAKPTNLPPRSLTTEDLGVKGNVEQLNGTFSVQGKVAVVQIEMIEGVIKNPNSVLPSLMRLGRSNGADILIVRATVANPKLYELMMRMGATSERGVETLTTPLR